MKAVVNINTCYILMSEAVTVPSLMTLTVSEESLARDTHTHMHRLGSSFLLFANVAFD